MTTKQSPGNLIWMDLEMTGLDARKEAIIEIASLVTDSEMNILEEGPSLAIHQDDSLLAGMDAWCQKHHSASGLIQRVRESKITVAEAERLTLDFVKKYCPPQTSPLCGNSVWQDRRFLDRYMPELHDYLNYRNIDVSTIKELVKRWYPDGAQFPPKSEVHLALLDIRQSRDELLFYRKHYFPPAKDGPPPIQSPS